MIKSRKMRWAGHITRMGAKQIAYHRWVDNIKMDLREIEWDVMDWIDLAQDMDQ
jgi:hypothetical protein